MERVLAISQDEALKPSEKKSESRIPLVVTYNPDSRPIRKIVNNHWEIFKQDERLKKVFKNRPLIAYRKPENLKDLLVRSKFVYEEEQVGSCSACRDLRCSWCSSIRNTDSFQSENTKRSFKIFHKVNCKAAKVIYLATCKCCRKQYVGKA